jgi:hypothetical protein
MSKKFAFLLMYEVRTLINIEKIYQYVIDYYNADVIICCQELHDTNEKLELLKKNQVFKKVYKHINPTEYYNNNFNHTGHLSNWNNNCCLQIYINWNEMASVLEQYKNDYDYFILLRSDINIAFPFPKKELFENITDGIYTFDANYARIWGNYSTGVFVHKNFIIDYLNCTKKVLQDNNLINRFLLEYTKYSSHKNQESFKLYCMAFSNLTFKFINNINIYFVTESMDTKSTWSIPTLIDNEFVKYPEQYNEVKDNLQLWNSGYVWVYENNNFLLQKLDQ